MGGRRWSLLRQQEELQVRARLWLAVGRFKRANFAKLSCFASSLSSCKILERKSRITPRLSIFLFDHSLFRNDIGFYIILPKQVEESRRKDTLNGTDPPCVPYPSPFPTSPS